MSDKYCPAGKCKCEHHGGANCYAGPERIHVSGMYSDFEQCPWPSRQVMVEPQMITVETNGITAACRAAFEQGEIAGRSAGLREAVEAVGEKRKLFEHGAPLSVNEKIAFDAIDAALRALEVKP